MPHIEEENRGLNIVILGADDFPEELYPKVKGVLLEYIENQKVSMVTAGGDKMCMIYRLLCELGSIYPSIFFSMILSNKASYCCKNEKKITILSVDPKITYKDNENAAENRDNNILRGADIVLCRQCLKYSDINNIRFKSLNQNLQIMLFK